MCRGGRRGGAGIRASSSWRCWQRGGDEGQVLLPWKVTKAITSAQTIRAPLFPSLLSRGRRGCEVWRRTEPLCPCSYEHQEHRVPGCASIPVADEAFCSSCSRLCLSTCVLQCWAAEGFPSTETAKACGLFSKQKDFIYKHLHDLLAFKGELQRRLHGRAKLVLQGSYLNLGLPCM